MTTELEPGAQRPGSSTQARRRGEVVRLDASVTIGAVFRAVRRGDIDGPAFRRLRGALRARAAEGDPASRIVADWVDRGRTTEETR